MSKLPAKISNTLAILEAAQLSAPADKGDFDFLKMDKAGDWVYGADETAVNAASEFVIDPMSYCQGFIAWDDGDLVDEQMAVAGSPPILRSDLPDVTPAQWNTQIGIALKGVSGADTGAQLLYKASSKGGMKAIKGLIDAVVKQGQGGSEEICPVVTLKTDSYRHKKYGKIFTPELNIVDWIDIDADPAAEPAAKEPKAKAPRRRTRA